MTFDMFTVTTTMCIAVVACVVNFRAATHGPVGLRTMNAVRGMLAAIYVAAYLWLLWNLEQRAAWSRVMNGVSVIVWIVVWTLPPALSLRLETRAKRVMEGITSK